MNFFKKSAIILHSSFLFKKLMLILISSFLIFNSAMALPLAAHAADEAPSTWYSPGIVDWYKKVYDGDNPSEIFGERYTAAQVQWILYSLVVFPLNVFFEGKTDGVACLLELTSESTIDPISCLMGFKDILLVTMDRITPEIKLDFGDLINPRINQGTNNKSFLTSLFNSPERSLSGINYVKNSISKFGLVNEANAQGFGYGAVDGLQKYWTGFRNIAYALTVLVVIVFAFMIMFRVKLSPQLVISVQSVLPKIVMALILATFSYAIAGFVIDLSYVVGGLLASLMSLAGFSVATPASGSIPAMSAFENAFQAIVPIEATTVFGAFYIFFWMLAYAITFLIASIIAFVSTIFGGLSIYGAIVGFITIFVTLWVAVLMVWYTLTIPWKLIKNLISLFVSIVVAPIQIIMGAIVPTIGFSTWLRKIIAEALVFPLAGLFMFLAGKTLAASMAASFGQIGQVFIGTPNQNLWAPPILGSSADMAGILWLAASFMFITMIPKAVDIMKMLVMGAKFDFGTAMGEAAAPLGMYGKYAASQMGKSTEGTLPWPFNKSKTASDWWSDSTGKVRSAVRTVSEAITQQSRH